MRIKLCGEVCGNDYADLYRYFGFDVCCPNDIRQAIESCADGEELTVEVNSLGGSVYAGFEMYTLLRSYNGRTVAEVQGIAASAASVILAGCGEVKMSPVGQIMIHRSNAIATGNSRDLAQAKQMLDTIDQSILNAYEEKCGGKTSREALARMMRNETFMPAQEAIDCGLADSMLEAPETGSAGMLALAAASAGGNAPFAIPPTLPPVEDLLRVRAQLTSTANTEAPENIGGKEGGTPMTIEELRAQFPEQVAAIEAEHANAKVREERERLAAIDTVAALFDPALVAEAKYGEQPMTAAELTLVAAQKAAKAGSKFLADQRLDAEESGAEAVAAVPTPPVGNDVKNAIEQARADARAFNKSRKETR